MKTMRRCRRVEAARSSQLARRGQGSRLSRPGQASIWPFDHLVALFIPQTHLVSVCRGLRGKARRVEKRKRPLLDD